MDRVHFIEHRGQQVLLIDYSGISDEREALQWIEYRKQFVANQPGGEMLTLTDLSNAHFTRAMITAAKEAAVLDRPHLKRAAVVGADSATPQGTLDAVATFASRTWAQFRTREEALDWLVAGAEQATA